MDIIKILIEFLNRIFKTEKKDSKVEDKHEEDSTPKPIEDTETTMVGTNLTKTVSEQKSYKCWVQTIDGKIVGNTHIEMTVSNKTYVRDTDSTGVAELPIRLNKGDYEIHSVFKGADGFKPCEITNYIHVDADKTETKTETKKEDTTKKTTTTITKTASKPKTVTYKPNSKGEYWNPRYLSNGEEKQSTGYYCADVSIMQCVYELYGKDLSQRQIAQWAGTTTSGTGHSGINQALATINKKYGYKMTYEWKNFSKVGWNELAQICKDPNRAFICHHMWHSFDGTDSGGHYTTFACINPSKKYCYEIYSLRGATLVKRSFSYMEKCMNEINQPSICIITKN